MVTLGLTVSLSAYVKKVVSVILLLVPVMFFKTQVFIMVILKFITFFFKSLQILKLFRPKYLHLTVFKCMTKYIKL